MCVFIFSQCTCWDSLDRSASFLEKMLGDAGDIRKHYDVKGVLGVGGFAIVRRAVRKADQLQFAVKVC